LDSQRRPITKSQREAGEYPYYGANGIQDYVADYIFDGVFVLVGEDGSVLTPNGNPVVTWAEGEIWVNNHAHILAGTEIAQLRFLFYVLQTLSISHLVHGNIPKLTKKDLQELQIPLPPLAVQSEIVRILDKFTLYKSELAAELAARLQQYEYYRDQLLTFDDTVKKVKLGEVAENLDYKRKPITASQRVSGEYPYYGASGIVDYVEGYIFDGDYLLISEDGANLVARNSPIAFSIHGKNWVNNHAHVLKFEHRCTRKYVEYYINSISVEPYISAGAQPKLNQAQLNNILIPLPPLSEQERIVSILDRFDKLCHDIREGLPAEVDLRQKQYEHYRDRLLTFEAAK
jgi:type I restriction enzyme S subunit